jgi:hypothetical protein
LLPKRRLTPFLPICLSRGNFGEVNMARTVFTRPCVDCGVVLKMAWNSARWLRCVKCQKRNLTNEMLLKNHGISIRDFEEKLKEQKGVCACCSKQEARLYKGKPAALKVVKENDTFKLLCLACKNRDKR